MDSQVEEIKSRVDIVGLISGYVSLKKAGRNYKANCPFHSEKTPSFMVSPDRQIYKCFGCSEGGDVFAFLRRMEGMEFGESLKFLADRAGIKLRDYKPSPNEARKEILFQISELTAKLYNFILTKHKLGQSGLAYLTARGVNQKSIVDFQLGAAPNQRNFLLKFLTKKGFKSSDIVAAGLALPTSDGIVDRFRGRVIFPITDAQGRVVGFSGRVLGDLGIKYMNSPETLIFDKSSTLYGINLAKTAMKKEKTAILVEGNLDVISSHQIGVVNTIAPLGTALTEKHIISLKRFAEKLLIGFDTDLAGDAAAKRGIELAENAGLEIRIIQIGEGKDPDDLIKKSPTDWKKAVKEAVPIYDYFISSAIKRYGVDGGEGKRKIAKEVLPLLARIDDEILKSHYLQSLSSRLSIKEETLRGIIEKFEKKEEPSMEAYTEKPKEKAYSLIEKYLLALIIQTGELNTQIDSELFKESEYAEIYSSLVEFKKKTGRLKLKDFSNSLREDLLKFFDELLLFEIDEDIIDNPGKVQKEIDYCLGRLKELNLRKKLREISLAIKQAEIVGNDSKVKSLSEQFSDLTEALNTGEMQL